MNYSYLAVARLRPGVTRRAGAGRADVARAADRARAPEGERGHRRRGRADAGRHGLGRADAAVRPAGRGRGDAADRLRQPREPARRARAGASARAGRPRRARRRAGAAGRAVDRRAAADARGRRRARTARRGVGDRRRSCRCCRPDMPRVENVGLHLPVLVVHRATLAAIAVFVGVWPALEASRGGLARVGRRSVARQHRHRAAYADARHPRRRPDRGDAVAGRSAPRC